MNERFDNGLRKIETEVQYGATIELCTEVSCSYFGEGIIMWCNEHKRPGRCAIL